MLKGGKHVKFNLKDIYVKIVSNEEDCTWMDKCNLGDEEEEEEP